MRISIITVVYNAIDSLEQTMLSVFNQTYSEIEYIVIDGGSTDGSLDIIEKHQNKISLKISESDKGIYDAMNKGLKLATGDFVFFLNSGDLFFENKTIEKVVQKISDPNSLYYGNVYLNNLNKLYWGEFSRYKLAIGNICHQAIFYPRSIYSKYQYNLKYRVFADYYYNLSIFPIVKFIYIPETISFYDNAGFSVATRDVEFEKVVNKMVRINLGLLPLWVRLIYWSLVHAKRKIIK